MRLSATKGRTNLTLLILHTIYPIIKLSTAKESELQCTIQPNGDEVCSALPELPSWCTDDHEKCPFWAEAGECDNNPNYMLNSCRRSCRNCGEAPKHEPAPAVVTDLEMERAVMAYGEKQEVGGAEAVRTLEVVTATVRYMEELAEKNELPSHVMKECKNRKELCAFWAAIGECEANPAYMVTNCAPSCRSCHMIDFDSRCPPLEGLTPAVMPGSVYRLFERIVDEYGDKVTVVSRPEMTVKESKRDPWVITIDDFLSAEEADYLAQKGHESGYERSKDVGPQKFDGSYEPWENTSRTSTNSWCSSKNGCRMDAKVQVIMNRIATMLNIPVDNFEDFQMLRYEEGQYYHQHHDYIPHQKSRQCGPRILTFFQYLSDVEEGGGTRFPKLDKMVLPKKGRILLWPNVLNSDPTSQEPKTHHEAMPVIKGLKYAANSWIHLYDVVTPQKMGCS